MAKQIALLALVGMACFSGSAIAQTSPTPPPVVVYEKARSLTTTGQGQVTAPADTALLEFRISSRDSAGSQDNSAGLSLQTLRKFTEDALKPTVDALLKAGVPQRNILLQSSSLQNPKLLVTVEKPTQEGLQQITLAVEQSLRPSRQLFLQSIGAVYSVNTCQPLERAARRLALTDAQRQIATLAQDLSVPLGELLSASTSPLIGASRSSACGTRVGIPTSAANAFLPPSEESLPPYDPADLPQVQIRSQVSLTHGIKPIE